MPRFRYSLRTLFIVMTLAAIPLGWLGYQARIVAKRKAMLEEITTFGGNIELDGEWRVYILGTQDKPSPLPWYRHMLGDKEVWIIYIDDGMRERTDEIESTFPEAVIR